MSAKAIREFDGKHLLNHFLKSTQNQLSDAKLCQLQFSLDLVHDKAVFAQHVKSVLADAEHQHPWLLKTKLVCKPDQLIKRRGKNGLLGVNLDWEQANAWITQRAGTMIKIEKTSGFLDTFIVEEFCKHSQDTEFYICIQSVREGDIIYFTHEGGVDIGDVDSKAERMTISAVEPVISADQLKKELLSAIKSEKKKDALIKFITDLHKIFVDLNFTYLEINPLVVIESENAISIHYLDLAAKIDQTADFECGSLWAKGLQAAYPNAKSRSGPTLTFPAPFGRQLTPEEAYIAELDSKTGASLKLTVLNPHGRIWTMVAGGGASVVYADAIAALGFSDVLANYGEYSGAPSESQTYEYAKTILNLMTRDIPNPKGKILFIGGGIANFTNVAATFKGIIKALNEYQKPLQSHSVKIYVRRAGPNYQEGLRLMRALGNSLGVEINVFGPEMHVTGIVPLALTGAYEGNMEGNSEQSTDSLMEDATGSAPQSIETESLPKKRKSAEVKMPAKKMVTKPGNAVESTYIPPFTSKTKAFIYGMQPRAVQGMLDFDFLCKREEHSVACMIYPFGGHHVQKFYWGTKETLLPVYTTIQEACERFPDVTVVVNFASFRSVYESTLDLMSYSQLRTIAIIAEGVPERRAREILWRAKQKDILIIGPATVGGITPGSFKIGNTGGMMDNIVSSKLYRAGSVAYVSKSGGMSNELNNIISRCTDGVYEGIAIGGDRYPGSSFIDHMLRYEADPNVKIIVLLGEVGGVEEYDIADAVKSKKITKPVVAWCIGTCATMFTTDVQFGHAGSFANSNQETAKAKNEALANAGVNVPSSFEEMPAVLSRVYEQLVQDGSLQPVIEPEVPKIPIDYAWAQELGLVRKPASFISTICDDRGQELFYAGMSISETFKEDIGVGGVLSLLWFKRRLPAYATKFIEMVLMLTADHGPAVSGAHNTIVTARAGKDLISSLVSGLLTIGDRFGGALDGSAQMFSEAYDKNLTPNEFVSFMRKSNKLILGIGHKIKSRTNPDLRVSIVKDYVLANFPTCPVFQFALEVETVTTAKKDNLILNVDGAVGVAFVDLLRNCGAFSRQEAEEYIKIGTLNGLFVLGRSIGFIGHYLDQKRLKQGLYRHAWDDIAYMVPEDAENGGESTKRHLADGKVVAKAGIH